MEHDVVLTLEDGSVRSFRIYGRPKPRVDEVVTLPVNGKLIKIHIDDINGTKIIGSLDSVEAVETEAV
jgi:hypothetical protein